MRLIDEKRRSGVMATVLSSVLLMGGCTTYKYAFDMKTSFSEQKTYAWAPATSANQTGHLLESNVQVLADQLLAQKGFKKVPEKADLTIKMGYDSAYRSSYELQGLNLFIYKTENSELVWQGTALGTIDTDAASGNLKQAVEGILSNFPPKEK